MAVEPRRINEIFHGKRGISADTALRLGKFFGVDPQLWMNLQAHYDLEMAEKKIGKIIEIEVHALDLRG